jgi:hypothetical protein
MEKTLVVSNHNSDLEWLKRRVLDRLTLVRISTILCDIL